MAQYKIESPLVDGFKVGDIVDASNFADGINIDALVDGGFISVAKSKISTPTDSTKE